MVSAVSELSPPSPRRPRVLTVSSNKGGVGKTTVASNLAIYFRALREELPVLLVGLDDQATLDRMFALRRIPTAQGNLKHAWAERTLDRVILLGQYGVHFVPSPPDLPSLKARAEDPETLSRILEHTEWDGLVLLDTKSDLEALTQNALHAADRVVIPVADWASLEEAAKILAHLERASRAARARIVLTLVDARTHVGGGEKDLHDLLAEEIDRRGWPRYATHLSRSPRVEALNSAEGRSLSILHHAQGTLVHRQMRALAEEVLDDLGYGAGAGTARIGAARDAVPGSLATLPLGVTSWKQALLRGLRGR
jgi:cellulose biosynthesis protein BcsQ